MRTTIRHAPNIHWEKYMKKYIVFDYIKNGLRPAFNFYIYRSMMQEEQIQERLYKGDVKMLNYYKKIGLSWIPSHIYQMISRWSVCILYGGHLDLFLEYLKYRDEDVNNYHAHIITCLLRCNHVNQYKTYARTIRHFGIVKPDITFHNILTNFLATNFVLPVMTVTTFKFCINEFGLEVKIPKYKAYINAVSKKIWKNYTII